MSPTRAAAGMVGRTGLALALLCGAAVEARGQCPDGTPPPCPGQRVAARRAVVAVLPFVDRSRDTADAYVAESMADEVATRLGTVTRLAVASSAAARRVAAAVPGPAEQGRALGAGYLVAGTLQRAGGRVRVSAELVRAASGVQLWSAQYDRGAGELLSIQSDIARNVAGRVLGALLPDERARLAVPPTANPVAYDLYLRGTRAMFDAGAISIQRAIASFEAAAALDPRFGAAQGRLAAAYAWAINRDAPLPGTPPDSALARAGAAAERALALDSASAVAWAGRGTVLFYRDPPDYAGAAAALVRATLLDSSDAPTHLLYSLVSRRLGNFPAAEAAARRALAIDPSLAQPYVHLVYAASTERRLDGVLPLLDSAIERAPGEFNMWLLRATFLSKRHRHDEALRDARRGLSLAAPAQRGYAATYVALVMAAAGDRTGAAAVLDSALAQTSLAQPTPRVYPFAAALVAVGRTEDALRLLEEVRPRGAWLWSYLVLSQFDSLRGDSRFQRLMEEARPPGAPRLP